jgi:predicted transcriptional regulator
MERFNGLKIQDVLISLKILTFKDKKWIQSDLATALEISVSEISGSLERLKICGLIDASKKKIMKQSLREFLIYGLKYVYPAQLGSTTRGIATAHSAFPINTHVTEGNDIFVWPYYKGTRRGNAISPLYPTVPKIASKQTELYELLVIVDTLRIGRVREKEFAIQELDKRLYAEGE